MATLTPPSLGPPVIITTDLSTPPTPPPPASSEGHLSTPAPHGSSSSTGSPSPTLTNLDDEPASPTEQTTSLALRGNHPTKESGSGTLGVLANPGIDRRHTRAASEVTWASGDESRTDGATLAAPASPEKGGKSGRFEEESVNPAAPAVEAPKKSLWGKVRQLLFNKKKEEEINDPTASGIAHIDPSKDFSDPAPFHFRPFALASLLDPKSLESLERMGGIEGVLHGLGADGVKGLSVDAASMGDAVGGGDAGGRVEKGGGGDGAQYKAGIAERERVYGKNMIPKKAGKSFLLLCWMALQDKMLILLCIAAVVSLALGIYTAVGAEPEYVLTPSCPDQIRGCVVPSLDWVEGVAIAIAVIVIVLVSSLSDYRKEKQFQKLNEQREDRTVIAIRNGKQFNLNTKDIVVGDILVLAPGEVLPCDGIFLRGSDCKADEAAATGESDLIKKATYDECIKERDGLKEGERLKKDCFLISGSKIADGVGEYVVVATGQNSFNGRLMMSLQGEAEATPLQIKLNGLADRIAQVGGGAGGLLFFALMIRFFVQLGRDPNRTADAKAQAFIQILIISVTLVVVSVPEGLPLAVVLALSFATRKMMSQNLLVRVLASCETMGNATVICTDKTGTLTKADMLVVAGSLGVHGKFVDNLTEHPDRDAEKGEGAKDRLDFTVEMSDINTIIPDPLRELLNQSIAINSTAFEEVDPETGGTQFVGSKTETALLKLLAGLGWPPIGKTRSEAEVLRMIPFSSEQKCMACIIRLPGGGQRLLVKGASEILTKQSSSHIEVSRPGEHTVSNDVVAHKFTQETRDNINRSIIFYANQSLRTIALCYRDFGADENIVDLELGELAQDLTLAMVVAIEDPLRDGVIAAVANCQKAGLKVVMVTGDNVLTARSIGKQCGILHPGGVIMEGPTFRSLNPAQRIEIVPHLSILARSSPEDKRILVETHKSMGEIVAASGDGANDASALKLANVGFSMGIAGTEVAKTASDIIIMDDSFASMVTACMWGREVNDAVRRFLQFQLSVNMSAIIITFISAIASDSEESVLSAVQLLWINLVMDTLAALALASNSPTQKILDRKPDRKSAPLLSADMLKMIIGQGLFQAIVCLVLHFAGHEILREPYSIGSDIEIKSLVFNVFVFCQIFNIINCRQIDRTKNVFENILKNTWFNGIFLIILGGQVLISFVGGRAFSIVRINGRDWGISIVIGLISLPLGFLIRMIPTQPFENFLIRMHIFSDPNALPVISTEAEEIEYNEAVTKVRDNLSAFARIRGGRLRASPTVLQSRNKQLDKQGIQPQSLMAMIPSMVAAAVGAGTSWAKQAGLADPASNDPSRSTANLWDGKLTFYEPDVNSEIYKKYGSHKG